MKRIRILLLGAAAAMGMTIGGCSREETEVPSVTAADQASGVVSSSQDADGYVYEKRNEIVYATGDVNIRSAATSQSDILGVLSAGQSITRIAYNYSWSKVVFENKTCYIASGYLTTEEPADEETQESADEETQEPTEEETGEPSLEEAEETERMKEASRKTDAKETETVKRAVQTRENRTAPDEDKEETTEAEGEKSDD